MQQSTTSLRQNNLRHILARLPEGVQLVAVSKFQPLDALADLYEAGQRVFGESRVDEVVAKAAALPADCRWHFIGHLQTNKLRRLLPIVHMIESVDSLRLLRLISVEAERIGRTIDVLLQVHVAAEETKTGFLPSEIIPAAQAALLLPGIHIRGIMGMATNTPDTARIAADFAAIAALASELRTVIPSATTISMGMSGDWHIALAHGANSLRIGSSLFGPRLQ